MAYRKVDVVLDHELIVSYPIVVDHENATPSEEDFVALARKSLVRDQYNDEVLERATFEVRQPTDQQSWNIKAAPTKNSYLASLSRRSTSSRPLRSIPSK